jgi:predicted CoA-binding protein
VPSVLPERQSQKQVQASVQMPFGAPQQTSCPGSVQASSAVQSLPQVQESTAPGPPQAHPKPVGQIVGSFVQSRGPPPPSPPAPPEPVVLLVDVALLPWPPAPLLVVEVVAVAPPLPPEPDELVVALAVAPPEPPAPAPPPGPSTVVSPQAITRNAALRKTYEGGRISVQAKSDSVSCHWRRQARWMQSRLGMVPRALIDDFLAQRTLALAGVSRGGEGFGNAVRTELGRKGFVVHVVHPQANTIGGEPCYESLAALPEPVGGLVLVTPPAETSKLVREAFVAGIPRIWMQQGAECEEAIRFCEERGIPVVHHECILMFAEPAAWFHRAHRWVRGVSAQLPIF